jgi:predicted phage-related endonuclease
MAYVYIFQHGKENKFKIGRTKKPVDIRLRDLQTGNPYLTIFDVIETEHDAKVENYMHRRLATKKVINGSAADEFYGTSIDELQPIIVEAKDYNREYLPTIEKAEEIGTKEPDGSTKDPGNATVEMHHKLLEIEEKMAQLESSFEYLKAEIKIAMDTASELRGIATWKNVTSHRLNLESLKTEHPDIYEKYLSTATNRVFKLEI